MAKSLAMLFGIVFVIVGLLGFVPNPLVGAGALFDTNMAHDLVHLVIGIILLIVAMKAPMKSGLWLKIVGIVYLLIAVLGFVTTSPLLGLVEVNDADNWLHVVLGIVLVLAGFAGKGKMKEAPMAPSMPSSMPPSGGAMH